MNELIKIEIVTPLELLKSKITKMSVLPGSEGELGIMSRHTPLMTLLNRGIIKSVSYTHLTLPTTPYV